MTSIPNSWLTAKWRSNVFPTKTFNSLAHSTVLFSCWCCDFSIKCVWEGKKKTNTGGYKLKHFCFAVLLFNCLQDQNSFDKLLWRAENQSKTSGCSLKSCNPSHVPTREALNYSHVTLSSSHEVCTSFQFQFIIVLKNIWTASKIHNKYLLHENVTFKANLNLFQRNY